MFPVVDSFAVEEGSIAGETDLGNHSVGVVGVAEERVVVECVAVAESVHVYEQALDTEDPVVVA